MRNRGFVLSVGIATFLCLAVMAGATDKLTILYSFNGKSTGNTPMGGLVADAAGNLYGTTAYGGANISQCLWSTKGCGIVYELSPNSTGGWTEAVIYSFTGGNDGAIPMGELILDSKGNLYGTAFRGGASSYGTVFELSPSSSGGWTEATLHTFTGSPDGGYPLAGLVMDAEGNLYGTTYYGGVDDCDTLPCGTVFEVTPNADGTWSETVLHAFMDTDGRWPTSRLAFDTAGNLYGTTTEAGSYDYGVVFMLSPSSSGWTLNILHAFDDKDGDGGDPQGGVILDGAGNVYGAATPVYELTPTGNFPWQETLLYQFPYGTGAGSSLALDRWGNLYGTTVSTTGPGEAFKISSASTGRTFTVLHTIPGTTFAPLIRDAAGNLYGTTQNGGIRADSGTVFELSPVK